MKKPILDNSITGVITGLLLPLITFYLIYRFMMPSGTLPEFVEKGDKADALTKFMSLAMLPNLLLFFIFIWLKRDFAAKGVLAATIIMALVVVVIKFVV